MLNHFMLTSKSFGQFSYQVFKVQFSNSVSTVSTSIEKVKNQTENYPQKYLYSESK